MRPEDLMGERITMEFKRFAQQIAVDAGIMAEMELRIGQGGSYDFLRDQIMVQMVTKLLCDDLPPEHVAQSTVVDEYLPTSTWQMWKFRNGSKWYARWLVERKPVKWEEEPTRRRRVTCTFDLGRYRVYPQARVQTPMLGNAVMFHTIRDIRWSEDDE